MSKDKQIKPGQIFVFGSNLSGYHGAGAARTAIEEHGAIMKMGEGLQGNSYAIPTKDIAVQTLPVEEIKKHVDKFIQFAIENPHLNFFVTRIGCGLAGYTDAEISPMFRDAPSNCELPEGWWRNGTMSGRS